MAVNTQSDYSHFVSLPLAIHHPELVDKLVDFQNTVLQGTNSNWRIEKSIFVRPKTFHLTILMLKLSNKDKVKTASNVLHNVSSKVTEALQNRPVVIKLSGLDCMIGSKTRARVVYAPVVEIGGEGRLLRACKVIIDAFVEAGLVMEKDAHKELKLHATLMNARFRKANKTMTKEPEWFNAKGIFDRFGHEEWGQYRICEAHLSQRFVFDKNGYFHCCGSIRFPDRVESKSGLMGFFRGLGHWVASK